MIYAATGVACAIASLALTAAALAYARRRALLDLPGKRRSHTVATPRGGGIGMMTVVAAAAALFASRGSIEAGLASAFVGGLLTVAAIGWLDDHRPLSARLRIIVHVVACAVFVGILSPSVVDIPWPWHVLWLLALVSTVNFWNFMDGIDGLMATQSAWVGGCLAVLHASAGQAGWALLCVVVAAASLGFLPFNFPRARIFMGDVGSGGLGFALGALAVHAHAAGAADVWTLLLIASVPLIDAGLTLLSRMLRGRRWYSAHREHLYQWMVRGGFSHARTTLIYLGWSLVVVLPLLLLASARPSSAPLASIVGLSMGAAAWLAGKRFVPRRVRGAGRS